MVDRMLVIDDDKTVLDSCQKIFISEGYDVVVTTDPQEGLKLASDKAFDVILVDWKMPGFDGLDVVEELDRRSPDSAMVMISGYPALERATEAMKRGAMDYVPKPFTPEEIVQTVKKAVRHKVTTEKKALGRVEKIIRDWQFPTRTLEDNPPKTIAETVASTIGVGKTTSPWMTVFILGILAGCCLRASLSIWARPWASASRNSWRARSSVWASFLWSSQERNSLPAIIS
jgi:FixJ family two-component response regulator